MQLLSLALLVAAACGGKEPPASATVEEVAQERKPQVELRQAGQATARQPVQFVVTARFDSGEPMTLDPIGEELMHVVAVRKDLSWLAHAHPKATSEGTYAFELTFPQEGVYAVFAVLVPSGRERQTVRSEVVVGRNGETTHAQLAASPHEKRFGAYDVKLATEPEHPFAGAWTTLQFHLSRGGTPVTNLRAHAESGHLIILDASAEHFVYAHSTDGEALRGVRAKAHLPAAPPALRPHQHESDEQGPDVQFHALFPAPGRYKVWAEFAPGDEHVTADFVIDVAQSKGGMQ